MKSFVLACSLLAASFAVGCAAESGDDSTNESGADLKAGVSHVVPGSFKLYHDAFHKVTPGCDVYTALQLKQAASGAVAVLEERVGGMCMIAIPPNHREYNLRQTDGHCNMVFEGENGSGPHSLGSIKIEDNRGTTCMMDTVFQGEIVVTETLGTPGGPVTSHLFSADNATVLEGKWGADQANMTFDEGTAHIEFGCGSATIDAVTFTDATTFTATGTELPGIGIQPPDGHGPPAQPATFKGKIDGNELSLEMTVRGSVTKMTFTKNREVQLFHCL
jgi:hypothetical protein